MKLCPWPQHQNRLKQFGTVGTFQNIAPNPPLKGCINVLLLRSFGQKQNADVRVLLEDRLNGIHAPTESAGVDHNNVRREFLNEPDRVTHRGSMADNLDM